MNALPRSYGTFVKDWVQGRHLLAEDAFKKRLGQTAWLVWCKLCLCRDEEGYTYVTRQTLRRGDLGGRKWQRLTEKQVKGSLSRLRDAGLVYNLHYVPSKGAGLVLMKRRVLGARMLDPYRGDCVAIPSRLLSCIESLKSRGGAREGAGRKPKCGSAKVAGDIFFKRAHIRGGIQKGPHSFYSSSLLGESVLSKERTPLHESSGEISFSLEVNDTSQTEVSTSTIEHNSTIGSRIGSTTSNLLRRDDRLHHPAIPPFPGPSVVQPAKLPSPPKLDKHLSEWERVMLLQKITFGVYLDRAKRVLAREWIAHDKAMVEYIEAVKTNPDARKPTEPELKYPWQFSKQPHRPKKTLEERQARAIVVAEKETEKKLKEWEADTKAYEALKAKDPDSKIPKPRKPAKRRPKKVKLDQYEVLARGAELLIEHDLAPALWVAWSIDGHEKHAGTHLAKTSWVFNEDRITKFRAIFRGEISGYAAGVLVPGVCFQDLSKRYFAMRRDLLNSNEDIDEIVDKHFPGRLYKKLVASAKAEAETMLSNFRASIERGEYIWD